MRTEGAMLYVLLFFIIVLGQGCGSGFEPLRSSQKLAAGSSSGLSSGSVAPVAPPLPETSTPQIPPSGNTQAGPSQPVPLFTKAMAMTFGTHHACAINSKLQAYCWGRGWEGQVADPAKQNHSLAFAIPGNLKFNIIRAGTHTTCGLATDGQIYCWGLNIDGVLGNGDTEMRVVPTAVLGLPTGAQVVDLGISNPFNLFTEHIGLGLNPNHACALLSNGQVWCWGGNQLGQLGRPSSLASSPRALQVPGISDAVDLSVGAAHTCVIKSTNHKIYCWGDNHGGQMGDAFTGAFSPEPVLIGHYDQARQVRAGGAFSCFIDTLGAVKCWGRNANHELGNGGWSGQETVPQAVAGLPTSVVSVFAGMHNGCVLTTEQKIYCWGDNWSGQLATGASGGSAYQAQATLVAAITEPVQAMSLGTFSMCALLASNKMKCWGHSYFGEAGNGIEGGGSPTPQDVIGQVW